MNFSHQRTQEKLQTELGEKMISALMDKSVIEIMRNEDGSVWIDTFDGMKEYGTMEDMQAHNMIRTIASASDEEITRINPDIGGEIKLLLPNSETMQTFRFQGLIPPLVSSPIFAIRKPASMVYTLQNYVNQGVISEQWMKVMKNAVKNRLNILVAGGTGSGKTTFCNAILDEIAKQFPYDRVVIIEDTLELQCLVKNRNQLRTSESRSMNDLLKFSLRLRPDRIIVGEVRGSEAHTMIKAFSTGHPGGCCTVHADDAKRALRRLEQLVMEANVPSFPEVIADTINLVVFISKSNETKCGRKVTEILKVDGYDENKKQYVVNCPMRGDQTS